MMLTQADLAVKPAKVAELRKIGDFELVVDPENDLRSSFDMHFCLTSAATLESLKLSKAL